MPINPLQKYHRVPKIYVKLPSRGQFYPDDLMTTSINDEVGVCALTARDQILLKTPDAMLNGEALRQVIVSCVPTLKDALILVEPDINTLAVAIKIATNGPNMDLELDCPSCQAKNNYQINLQNLLDNQSYIDENVNLEIADGLTIQLRPYNFEQRHLQILNELERAQASRILETDNNIGENEKLIRLSKQVADMTDRTFALVSKSVISITITATNEIVTQTEWINSYLQGLTKLQADSIFDKLREINEIGIQTGYDFTCNQCNHEWHQQLDLDPTSFFD